MGLFGKKAILNELPLCEIVKTAVAAKVSRYPHSTIIFQL
jgi:hypothetical protein